MNESGLDKDRKEKVADNININELPEVQRVSYYGALFAMAAVDGDIDQRETAIIYEILDLDGLSDEGKKMVHGFIFEPPPIRPCINELKQATEEVRFNLMIGLMEVALADDAIDDEEKRLLGDVQRAFKISDEQMAAIDSFVKKAGEIRERGLDDQYAADALKSAAAGLTGVGIPLAAVYLSGSVIGLSAAGITSGLAAVGLGLGMVPGIGVAVLVGAVAVFGVSRILDVGGKRKKKKNAADRERKATLVIKNLQENINELILRLDSLKGKAKEAEANREAIEMLTGRLKVLQQMVASRKRAMVSAKDA